MEVQNVSERDPNSHQDLLSFGLTDTLDVKQLLLGRVRHSLDGVEAGVLQLLQVAGTDATLLQGENGEGKCNSYHFHMFHSFLILF